MSSHWWGTKENLSKRMKLEIAYMQRFFNKENPTSVVHNVDWDTHFLVVTKSLELNVDNPEKPKWIVSFNLINVDTPRRKPAMELSSKGYVMYIEYPQTYPNEEPIVKIPDLTQKANHIFPDKRLCLHSHSGTRTGWDPSKSTAATFALWSTQWIRAYFYWKNHGRWPEAYEGET